jgi:hypothetical protein
VSCPARSSTRNQTGGSDVSSCKCDRFYYQQATSASPPSVVCSDCPQGGVCASDRTCAMSLLSPDSFAVGDIQASLQCPNPLDRVVGTWVRNELGQYRVTRCPAGFLLQRSEISNSSDQCSMCPKGTFSLEEVTTPSAKCQPCPWGASCPGGAVVIATEGYWQRPRNRRADLDPHAEVFRCPTGVCGLNNTCKHGRTGPVGLASSLILNSSS